MQVEGWKVTSEIRFWSDTFKVKFDQKYLRF